MKRKQRKGGSRDVSFGGNTKTLSRYSGITLGKPKEISLVKGVKGKKEHFCK